MKKANFTILISMTILIIILSGCAHTSPFQDTDTLYVSAAGNTGEFVTTIDTESSASVIKDVIELYPGAESFEPFINQIDRISISLIFPELKEDGEYTDSEISYYGAIEGNIPMALVNAALSFSDQWDKSLRKSYYFWENQETGLQLYAPENGIVLFSLGEMESVISKTYVDRDLYVPDNVGDYFSNSMAGVFVEKPKYLFSQFEEMIPFSLLESIDSIWLTIDSVDPDYVLYGIVETTQKSATTVISFTLKKKYLEKLREMETKPENWRESILVDSELEIVINNLEITDSELTGVFESLFQSLSVE